MALPGLNLTSEILEPSSSTTSNSVPRTINLSPGSEFRFEVSFSNSLSIKLLPTASSNDESSATTSHDVPLSGTAEVLGTELAPSHIYRFCGAKTAVYTHHGCTLEISGGPTDSEYVADETPMAQYANIHFALDRFRDAAASRLESQQQAAGATNVVGGPRILVLGPDNAGKTSLVKLLTAYAVREGRSPCVVNLDPKEGMLCPPGCLSAAVYSSGDVLDIEDAAGSGWGTSPVAGPSAKAVKMPVVYHYGYERVEDNLEMLRRVVGRMAVAVTSRYEEDQRVKESGIFVDLAGSWVKSKNGIDVVDLIVSEFSISVILILGSERIYSDMVRKYTTTANNHGSVESANGLINVLKVPKSGGVVDRPASYLAQLQSQQLKTYFFGTTTLPLSPYTQSISTSPADCSLTIYRLPPAEPPIDEITSSFLPGGHNDAPASAMSSANGASVGQKGLEKAELGPEAEKAVLVVKHAAADAGIEEIRDASVMGWLYVVDVEGDKKRARILSPAGGRLPSTNACVRGRWPEGVGGVVG